MTYTFIPNLIYRMPTHFGPSLGPRQGPEGRKFTSIDNPNSCTLTVDFLSNPMQLEALLPECFELGATPVVSVQFTKMSNIEWLAGRGYSMLGVSFPATFKGNIDNISGTFLAVLWENMCEPIITGREELGFSKIFCELSDPTITHHSASITASWQGFDFLGLEITNLHKDTNSVTHSDFNRGSESEGLLHYKYIPKTGDWGVSDIEYPVFSPYKDGNTRITKTLTGSGKLNWHNARWEDLPTLHNIVNRLSELEVRSYVSSSMCYSTGSTSLSDQRILI